MNNSKDQAGTALLILFALTGISLFLAYLLIQLSGILLFGMIFLIFILISICIYVYFIAMSNIFTNNLRKTLESIGSDMNISKKTFFNPHFDEFRTLNQLAKYYDETFKKASQIHVDAELKLKELERINVFKNHTLDTLLKVNQLFLELQDSKEYYSMILSSAIDVIENASKGSILQYNPSIDRYEFQTCIGYDFDELKKVTMSLEETFLFMNSHGNYDEPIIIKNVREYDSNSLNTDSNEHLDKAGGLDIEEALSSPIIIDGQIFAMINIDSVVENAFDEIDKQLLQFFATQVSIALRNKYLVDETVNMSRYDKLTGALNRNYFEKILSKQSELSLENMESYALVLCDINYLKIINDTFGHSAGDAILKEFSELVHKSIRDTDSLSRIGGDEFVILLRNISYEKAEEKMALIFNRINTSVFIHNRQELPISFSYGIASSPDDSMIYDVLLKIADIKMYKFKESYKENHPDKMSFVQNF